MDTAQRSDDLSDDIGAPAVPEDAEEMLRVAAAAALWVHDDGAAGAVPHSWGRRVHGRSG